MCADAKFAKTIDEPFQAEKDLRARIFSEESSLKAKKKRVDKFTVDKNVLPNRHKTYDLISYQLQKR